VTEERALDELTRNRGEVDCDERRIRLPGLPVDETREQFLPGAALPKDQHGRRELRHLLHQFEDLPGCATCPGDELAVVLLLGNLGAQTNDVPVQVLSLAGVGDKRTHTLEVEVFEM
jgi:hypothetical protein